MADLNQKVIREFRAHDGVVGGPFRGMNLLLLHTRGAKTGRLHINPVATIQVGDDQVIAASNNGADSNPDWYYNLKADPELIIEIGPDKKLVQAEITTEPERSELYGRIKDQYPNFGYYQAKTERIIPVIKLIEI